MNIIYCPLDSNNVHFIPQILPIFYKVPTKNNKIFNIYPIFNVLIYKNMLLTQIKVKLKHLLKS